VSQFLDVAETLLRKHKRPISARELVDLATDEKLFSDTLSGKTPHQTMKSKISTDIIRKGDRSRFVRTAPGRVYDRALLEDTAKAYEAKRYTASPPRERVMVFPSRVLDGTERFQGIKESWIRVSRKLFRPTVCTYIDRIEAEQRQDVKQVLTYILVTRRNRILAFRRGTFSRVEDYLRGSNCIGFGGHVAEIDRSLYNVGSELQVIRDNAVRELFEELALPQKDKDRLRRGDGLRVLGLLNDDSSPTGRRHFAVVLQYSVSTDPLWEKPQRGEKSITQLRWIDLNALDVELKDFEYWSQLCLTGFFPSSVRAQPSYIIRRTRTLRPPSLLCLVGGIGSGKSLATELLRRDFGYSEINSGSIVAQLVGIPAVSETGRAAFQKRAWQFIQNRDGPKKLALALLNALKSDPQERILIDGIRQTATLRELKRIADRRIGIIFVHAPPNVAFQFYSERSRQVVSFADFLKLSEAPVEQDVKKMIGIADAVLYNWMGKSMYKEAIGKLMQNVGVSRRHHK
jgi:predicted NUDIX family phosphoesterase/dephospho-CoA kinase